MVNIEKEFVYLDIPTIVYKMSNQNIHKEIYYKVDDMICGKLIEVSNAYNSVFTIGQLIKWNQHEKHS